MPCYLILILIYIFLLFEDFEHLLMYFQCLLTIMFFFLLCLLRFFCPCSYRLFVFLLLIFIALYRFSSSDTSGMNIFSKFVACFFCFLSGVLKDKNFNIFMNSNNFFVICTFSVLSKKHFHSQTWSMYFLLEIL